MYLVGVLVNVTCLSSEEGVYSRGSSGCYLVGNVTHLLSEEGLHSRMSSSV